MTHPSGEGVNLNSGFQRFKTAAELYADIRGRTSAGGDYIVRNYAAVIEDMRPESVLVETELFPRGKHTIFHSVRRAPVCVKDHLP